ncbi:MAG: TrpB-like pyridoxal phosphate-dependent enzyme [Elusimicrobiota bacterium]
MDNYKITLSEKEIPRRWYNIIPDLPTPLAPPLKPDGEVMGPEDLEPIFARELIKQEASPDSWIEIPDEIVEIYKIWRPAPLRRAYRLEQELKTPARIYYKDESVSPPGSHKPNTAVPQAYYNKKEGITTLSTETGAGQWGSALAFATNKLGMDLRVYMVKVSFNQKPYRKVLMEIWNAKVFPSPTDRTQAGRSILEKDPECLGSLGIAISEAVEDAATNENVKYTLGSVLNHVMLHQTVIGLEAKKQLKIAGESPDILIGCVGGGSNFAGLTFPFVKDKLDGKLDTEIIAVEPTACPTLTKGPYRYDHGDAVKMTPLLKMYTLGHDFVPPGIHSGGLRYHGGSPLVSSLVNDGVIKARAYHQLEVFDAALKFARTEGLVCAPETAHAVKAAIDEAQKCKQTGEEKCIVFNYSGHGFFDLSAYRDYLSGNLQEYEYPDEKIKESISALPEIE